MTWRRRFETVRRVGLGQVVLARTWIALDGDARIRRRLKVPRGGLVLDVGAYEGEFAAHARSVLDARVIAIEPIPEFTSALRQRFAGDDFVTVVPVALGRSNGLIDLQVAGDGSSAWVEGESSVEVPLVDAAEIVGDRQVDLLKMNAEGAEFDVLDRLVETGQIRQVQTILVQFHKFVPDAQTLRSDLRRRLQSTHQCVVNVPWVWELWRRR